GRVRAILQSSTVSIDSRDTSGRTALFLAVLHRHEAVVRALLGSGANPNLGGPDGRTPLEVARDQNQPAIVVALHRAGAR
ncbi:MAG TPA: ankyrin repeat domain-containing protein, partial [Steroidobacteraceae bacterium]|nr:ankyrin repeat domain-containing protein [Steroidobacteraceae bacterium]